MSFDIFNYASTLEELDRVIATLNSRIITSTIRRMDIMAMDDSARELLGCDNIRLTCAVIDDTKAIEELDIIKNKIHDLCELPAQMKMQLFIIFRILGVRLEEYASRLPICYEGLIMDISPKLNAAKCTQDEKRDIAREIYKKYELLPLPKYYRWVAAEGMI
jgi:hypothetical protein